MYNYEFSKYALLFQYHYKIAKPKWGSHEIP